jgi:hypothetical protein
LKDGHAGLSIVGKTAVQLGCAAVFFVRFIDFNPSGKGGLYVTTDKAQAQEWTVMRGLPEITQFVDVPKSKMAKPTHHHLRLHRQASPSL